MALGYHREVGPSDREERSWNWSNDEPIQGIAFSKHDEYLRLGVMRLLRDLPQYLASFNYRWKDHEIDCVLRPPNHEAPTALAEFKLRLESIQEVQEAFRQLRRASSGWDKSTLFVILTIGPSQGLLGTREGLFQKLEGRNILVIYDPERDGFIRDRRVQFSRNGTCIATDFLKFLGYEDMNGTFPGGGGFPSIILPGRTKVFHLQHVIWARALDQQSALHRVAPGNVETEWGPVDSAD